MDELKKEARLGPRGIALFGGIITVLISVTGFWVSKITEDPEWAARFGALIVIFALAILAFMKFRAGELDADDEVWERQSSAAIDSITAGNFDRASQSFTANLNEYGVYVRAKWFFIFEVSVIAFGTALWGFGDLVANRLVICGAWICC